MIREGGMVDASGNGTLGAGIGPSDGVAPLNVLIASVSVRSSAAGHGAFGGIGGLGSACVKVGGWLGPLTLIPICSLSLV